MTVLILINKTLVRNFYSDRAEPIVKELFFH